MKRICLVVQRYGAEIVGGSERLAHEYAKLLKRNLEVHVVTSCAADHTTWRNVYQDVVSEEEGVHIHRFRTDFERTEYWHQLHLLMILRPVFAAAARLPNFSPEMWPAFWHNQDVKGSLQDSVNLLPRAAQEEFVRRQGPYCSGLLRFLEENRDHFDSFVFFTYLYPTTYFGLPRVPPEKCVLVPTLHDEPTAYLPIFRTMMESVRMIFLSPGELKFAEQLCRPGFPGTVIGTPIETSSSVSAEPILKYPYVLYCGRIEGPKGSRTLFSHFLEYKKQHPSDLKLVLTGHAAEPVPQHPDIQFLDYVDDNKKRALMRHAIAFIHPSPFESFSIVLLEAFSEGTPCIVNGHSIVLSEHCRLADAGFEYREYEEFADALSKLRTNAQLRERLGANAKNYARNYSIDVIGTKLSRVLEDMPPVLGDGDARQSIKRDQQDKQQKSSLFDIPPADTGVSGIGINNIKEDLSLPTPVLGAKALEQVREYLSESIVTPEARPELLGYISEALQRFVLTLCLVPERKGKLLELGANPYFITILLKRFRKYDCELANFFSERQPYDTAQTYSQAMVNAKYGERHEFLFKVFNIERDTFPYADESFDVVLFCEILEHLIHDPVFAFQQIHRVLKPGGTLVLTTPNVARRGNVQRLAAGANIYDPYSKHGIYGRHNREYTTTELQDLLCTTGFDIETITTRDVHQLDAGEHSRIKSRSPGFILRSGGFSSDMSDGEYIFVRARKVRPFVACKPDWLYR